MKKLISILGSTGSVGLSTLNIVDKNKNILKPYIFSANKNYKLICKQIKKYKPIIFIVKDKYTYIKVLKKFKNNKVVLINDFKFLKIKIKSDITVSAIPGIAGLIPTEKMIKHSKKILLANKESIICGWNLIKNKAKKSKTELIPIDSEHYSILKLLEHEEISRVEKIYLTASGGPFLNYSLKDLKNIKPHQALKHPKWKMGKKITIDSSTLMNKILELIEAQKLFDLEINKLDILIHPNSLVHAILELKNGLYKFIYHDTSMKIPLANAIFDGDVNIKKIYNKVNFLNNKNLIFKKVNKKIFPAIILKDKISQFPSTPIIINAANEFLVDEFLKKRIAYIDIIKIIMSILRDKNYKKYAIKKAFSVNQILLIDLWARKTAKDKVIKKYE
tara:strand:- start:3145 stop:4314 length:1170 start_codon:yes stop_codon:yes gene_type:complete